MDWVPILLKRKIDVIISPENFAAQQYVDYYFLFSVMILRAFNALILHFCRTWVLSGFLC